MTRLTVRCRASSLLVGALATLLSLSPFSAAQAQNQIRFRAPTQQPVAGPDWQVPQLPAQPALNGAPAQSLAAQSPGPQLPSQALGAAAAQAQMPLVQPPVQAPSLEPVSGESSTAIASVLEQGRTLENQKRWGEAYALYEDTARLNYDHPQAELDQRLDLAKIHFDIGRRYADSTFRRNVAGMSDTDALEMYTDAANKLQAHYVQNPDWQALVIRGTHDLEVALGEQTFVESNLSGVSADRIDLYLRELHRQQEQYPAHSLNEARNLVWSAAQQAQLHLQLRPSVTMLEYTAAMLGGLDEFSSFLTSGQLNDLYSQIEGNFVGLGVELKAADGALLIVNVIHNSPAERAGILAGDKIVSVAGRTTADLNTDKAAELLQGTEGSTVNLDVVTGDQAARPLTIRRAHVDVPSVDDAKIVDRDSGIGYFKLTCFQKTTSHDVDAALWQLQRDGMRSLIIDLRGNPGGLLTSAVEVANKFVSQGSIVSTRGRSPGEDYNYTAQGNATWRSMPLVVLIDGDSASAAEILSGALRDYHRATIVGVRSYGKGSVQGIFPLTVGGAGVRLTTAKFYSPLGKPFSHVGVEPDQGYEVHVTAKPVDGHVTMPVSTGTSDDPFLNAGLRAARSQLAQR